MNVELAVVKGDEILVDVILVVLSFDVENVVEVTIVELS